MTDAAPTSAEPLPPEPSPVALSLALELVTKHRLRLAAAGDQRLGDLSHDYEVAAAAWTGPRAAFVGFFRPPEGPDAARDDLRRRCASALSWAQARLVEQKAERCDVLLVALGPVRADDLPRSEDRRVQVGVAWIEVASGSAEPLLPIPRGLPSVGELRRHARQVRDGSEVPTLAAVDLAERQVVAGGYAQPTRRALVSTPAVTYSLIGIFVAIYLAERSLTSASILDFGAIANGGTVVGPSGGTVQLDREWWRYVSSAFLHDDRQLLHVLFNCVAMFYIGRYVEQLYGRLVLLGAFLVTAAAGNLVWVGASAAGLVHRPEISLGASGGICGLMGLLVLLGRFQGRDVPPGVAMSLRQSVAFYMVTTLVFGFILSSVNNLAHIGGFAAGVLLSLVVPPLPQVGGRRLRPPERAVLVLIIGTSAVALGVAGWHVATALTHAPVV